MRASTVSMPLADWDAVRPVNGLMDVGNLNSL
jgi:hypothetical protein